MKPFAIAGLISFTLAGAPHRATAQDVRASWQEYPALRTTDPVVYGDCLGLKAQPKWSR